MYQFSYSTLQSERANSERLNKRTQDGYFSAVDAALAELLGCSTLKVKQPTESTFRPTLKEDSEEAIVLEFTVPGIDPKDIRVGFKGKELTVETSSEKYKWSSPFRNISPEGSTAIAKHGILTVRLLKQAEANYEISVSAE
jgi:HSP20 family molecular chaperone IbpA